MWKCNHCGKGGNQDYEESCWNCQYSRDGEPPHRPFEEIDPTLYDWAHGHSMYILTTYKDYPEFRDVFLDLSPKRRYRTSVDSDLDENRKTKISLYDYLGERGEKFESSLEDLGRTLNRVYELILEWDAENLAEHPEESKPDADLPQEPVPIYGPFEQYISIELSVFNNPIYIAVFHCINCDESNYIHVQRFATSAKCRSCKQVNPIVVDWSQVGESCSNLLQ